MPMMPKHWRKEARRLRKEAGEAGHDMTNFDTGDRSAIATCRNNCGWMWEIVGGSGRWLWLRDMPTSGTQCSPDPKS